MQNEPERLETLPGAASYAEVSVRTVQRWITAGLITAYRYRVGTYKVKVDLDEIDALSRPTVTRAG